MPSIENIEKNIGRNLTKGDILVLQSEYGSQLYQIVNRSEIREPKGFSGRAKTVTTTQLFISGEGPVIGGKIYDFDPVKDEFDGIISK